MIDAARNDLERRVVFLPPTPKDGDITSEVLAGLGIACVVCPSADAVAQELDRGAGVLLVAQEAIAGEHYALLKGILDRQVPWSDLPVIVLTHRGADSPGALDVILGLGNVSLLERPIRISALVSAVRTALRARARQYQIRAHLRDRELAASALRDADRRKDEFLAILAHELRNPLAPIRNALNILRLGGPRNFAAGGMVEMLERQVDQMVRLVDDLFEVSRITRGNIELRRKPFDLGTVIRDAIDTSRPLIDASRQTLEIDIASEPLPIDGDPVRLAQVFANLLNNASKYSDDGGSIWLTARRTGDAVEVLVRDRGLGIPKPMLPRVFDMFTQVDRRARRSQRGLGIGLTLVKSLVELHGGTVDARSDGPGLGSEFLVRLPLMEGAAFVGAPAARPLVEKIAGRRRVLVVDDNRDSADSIVLFLKLLGADVEVAYDGPSSLAAIDTFHPDAVLLDIGMPGMDGYEVARRIRLRPELDDVTLIALTGWGQTDDRRRSREAGFQHHLVKPADAATLHELLRSLDDGRSAPGSGPSVREPLSHGPAS